MWILLLNLNFNKELNSLSFFGYCTWWYSFKRSIFVFHSDMKYTNFSIISAKIKVVYTSNLKIQSERPVIGCDIKMHVPIGAFVTWPCEEMPNSVRPLFEMNKWNWHDKKNARWIRESRFPKITESRLVKLILQNQRLFQGCISIFVLGIYHFIAIEIKSAWKLPTKVPVSS